MRALLIVLDPLGVGLMGETHAAPGNDTLDRLFREMPGLQLPHLFAMGLGEILHGRIFDPPARKCSASYGRMTQRSAGTDSLSALWELAGAVSGCPFSSAQAFSDGDLSALAGDAFLFHGGAADAMPREVAEAHFSTGKPILTRGEGSALCVTAHASAMPVARLAHACRSLRRQADGWRIARLTGRLMTGDAGAWRPLGEPVSCPMVPPRTILNAISERGLAVEAVGGVHEAFARSGVTRAHATGTPSESLRLLGQLWPGTQNGLILAHLDFSAAGGWEGIAGMLQAFDEWLGCFLELLENDSLLLVAGANGGGLQVLTPNQARQEVPILAAYGGRSGPLGLRDSLADVAATLAVFFGIVEPGSPWYAREPLLTFHRPRGFDGPWQQT